MPFQKLVEKAYPPDKADKSYRDKLRKVINMVYVGVLASACKIEIEAVEAGIRREFPGRKAKAAEINISAARTGFEWAEREPAGRPAVPGRADGVEPRDKILIEGNKAAALGVALRRGQRADLVSDHPVEQPGGVRRGVPQEAPGRRRTASGPSPSSRPRTSWRPSAWPSARAGPAPGADGDRRARASR